MTDFHIINPSTGETIVEISEPSPQQIREAVADARASFDSGLWRHLSLADRSHLLRAISDGILDNAAELAQIETENTGKPIKETTFMDIPSAAETFAYFADHLEQYLAPEIITTEDGGQSVLVKEPRGVAVLVVPFNYPLLISAWKTAQALAAGNAVLLKPSELTPLSALKLKEIAEKAGLPEGVFQVLPISGSSTDETLLSDLRVDMISFTGGFSAGRAVMRRASETVKKIILELGGKSAALVLDDADLEITVNGLLTAAFLNQGQMCTAMSRILVSRTIAPRFIQRFVQLAGRIRLGPGIDFETQMGPLISEKHRQQVSAMVDKGISECATLLIGGKAPRDPHLANGYYFEPTVFAGVLPDTTLFQDEIFGPVTAVTEFADEDEAISLFNNSRYGLAGSIWSTDENRARRIAEKLDAGMIWINDYGKFCNGAPFGGFKAGGFGKELGREGLLEYCRIKQIYSAKNSDAPLVSQWYAFEEDI